MVSAGQSIKRERLIDVRLDPGTQFRVFILLTREPGGQIVARFIGIVPIVDPA
jgi:hypothetical protein